MKQGNAVRCSNVKKNKAITIQERLTFNIETAREIRDTEGKTALANQALGAAEIAVEFGLITYTEFERYIKNIFRLL